MPSWEYQKTEERKIIKAIRSTPPDIDTIKERVWMEVTLCSVHYHKRGLLSINVRRDAWLLLLGQNPYELQVCPCSSLAKESFKAYTDEYRTDHQIEVDIERSFVHFDGYDRIDPSTLFRLRLALIASLAYRESLARVIYSVLLEDPSLHYYQGFHDIVEFFLLISRFDVNWTYTMIKALIRTHLRDYMGADLTEVERLLQLLYPILEKRAPELVPILQTPAQTPVIVLPWVITLSARAAALTLSFAHSLHSVYQVARLMDVMLLHPLMPLYVSAAVVLHFREKLLRMQERFQLYQLLGRLAEHELPLEKVLRDAQFFFTALPPRALLAQGRRRGVELPEESMVLQFEKARADDRVRLRSFRNLYRVSCALLSLVEMIVRPGQTAPSTASVTGLLSLAAVGIAVATVIQIASNSPVC
ncbi:hypothetical protein BLSTO_03825 [Blastocystis sp. subtype 1]